MFRTILSVLSALCLTMSIHAAGAESYFDERGKDFGIVPRGPMLVHYFKVTNTTKETVTISTLGVSCGCVTATAPLSTIKPGESTSLTVTMDTRRFTGPKAVTVYVRFSAPRYEEVTLLMQANGRDDFSMTPDTLVFGTIRRGSEPKASVQVSFLSDPNFTIKDPTAESNFVKPEVTQIKRNGPEVVYEISAKLRPELPVGKWFTDVWVQTSNPSMPKLRIPLTVEVQPSIAVSPTGVQFNDVKVGGKAEQKVLVRAEKPFKILEIKGAEDGVKVESKLGEAKTVHILNFTYEPSKPGEMNKTLKIITDGGESEVLIPVRALAIKE